MLVVPTEQKGPTRLADVVPLRPRASAWREGLGHVLRTARLDQGLRLADVSARAGVSSQYLSEVERGRKEPSSEMLFAIGAALGLRLVDLAGALAKQLDASAVRGSYGSQLLAA